jgi:hypothetical protein
MGEGFRGEHAKCHGGGCHSCCHTGRDPLCSLCNDAAAVWCGEKSYKWLCLECFRTLWNEGKAFQGRVLVAPMLANELAKLLDKGTAA